jgi:hypothetical protein
MLLVSRLEWLALHLSLPLQLAYNLQITAANGKKAPVAARKH